jgi:hypothetical protein
MIVLVFPGSLNTSTIASMVRIVPLKKLKFERITHPIQIPNSKEINTCRVFIAKIIATNGGSIDQNP